MSWATSLVRAPIRSIMATQCERHSRSCPSDSVADLTKSLEAVTNWRDSLVRASLARVYKSRRSEGSLEAGLLLEVQSSWNIMEIMYYVASVRRIQMHS